MTDSSPARPLFGLRHLEQRLPGLLRRQNPTGVWVVLDRGAEETLAKPLQAALDRESDAELSSIMPRLRRFDFLEGIEDAPELVQRDFVGDLIVTYVFDYPTHSENVPAEYLAEKGLDIAALDAIAKDDTI